jgi:hypothetical protein
MSKKASTTDDFSVAQVLIQFIVIGVIFSAWTSPVIQPVKIMVVLFHELSHGLMAIATGGKVLNIVVTWDEGGFCETEGGIAALIVSAGYLGSMFSGGLLLYLSRFSGYVPGVYTILTLLLGAAILTVLNDPFTRSFATGLAAAFLLLGLVAPAMISAFFLRILGTVSCLYSLFDIYGDVLVGGRSGEIANDALVFSEITGVSPTLIGFAWLAVSFAYFVAVLRFVVVEPQPVEVTER